MLGGEVLLQLAKDHDPFHEPPFFPFSGTIIKLMGHDCIGGSTPPAFSRRALFFLLPKAGRQRGSNNTKWHGGYSDQIAF